MSEQTRLRTETVIPTADAESLLSVIKAELAEHDVSVQESGDGRTIAELSPYGMRIEFQKGAEGLTVRLAAREAGHLFFMKESLVGHTQKHDPEAAEAIRWSDQDAALARPPNFNVFDVVSAGDVGDGLRRVTLRGANVARFETGGLHFRAILPKTPGRAPVWPTVAANGTTRWPSGEDELHARALTVRHVHSDRGEIDVDIAVHAGGLISDWAATAAPGDVLGVMGPGGETQLPVSTGLLLAADRTGLPAMARLLALLPEDADGDAIVALPSVDAARAYLPATGLRLHALPDPDFRGGVRQAVRAIGDAHTIRYLWFAGEFADTQAIRAYAKGELGLDKTGQSCIAYWRDGYSGQS